MEPFGSKVNSGEAYVLQSMLEIVQTKVGEPQENKEVKAEASTHRVAFIRENSIDWSAGALIIVYTHYIATVN